MKVSKTGLKVSQWMVASVVLFGVTTQFVRADESCPIRFENTRQCARIDWKGPFSIEEDNPFQLVVWSMISGSPSGPYEDLKGSPVIEPFMDMPGMHHGTSPLAIKKVAAGIYNVTHVFLYMEGNWDIHLKQKSVGKILDEAVYLVNVPAAEGAESGCHCGGGQKT